PVAHLRVDDRVRDLAGLARDELAPDRVALRPEVLALVVEALAIAIYDDAERHRVEPRRDAAVELRRSAVDRHRVAFARAPDRLRARVEHCVQYRARVVRRAAHDEVVGRVSPRLAEPAEVRFEPARREHDGARGDAAALA